ncbi:MAG: hypothetical protein AABZ08_07500 [Planctomycetota bacterium]
MAARRGPTLFEAMSKAPQTVSEGRRPGLSALWGGGKPAAGQKTVVAEALTEDQARDELSRRQADLDERRRADEARLTEKAARKAEKVALKAARAEERRASGANTLPRLKLSLSTASCVGLVGLMSVLVLAAYSLGRQSKEQFGSLGTVAAVGHKSEPVEPTPKKENTKRTPAVKSSTAATKTPPVNSELSELLKKPELKKDKSVLANQPVRLNADEQTTPTLAEDLNYLQIESFVVTRERNGEQLAADVAHVRKFLLDKGVRTFGRKRSNGYVLFCEQGLAPAKDHAGERDGLVKKIRQLGAEYRAAGGQYAFKGCFFVSYPATKSGDPV